VHGDTGRELVKRARTRPPFPHTGTTSTAFVDDGNARWRTTTTWSGSLDSPLILRPALVTRQQDLAARFVRSHASRVHRMQSHRLHSKFPPPRHVGDRRFANAGRHVTSDAHLPRARAEFYAAPMIREPPRSTRARGRGKRRGYPTVSPQDDATVSRSTEAEDPYDDERHGGVA
jgi:hypothetical protein